jgi:hypothetical protein
MPASEFWVVYDYGMGGAWGLARAASADEVSRAFPELQVVSGRPDWMTADVEANIRENSSFVVDDPRTYPTWMLSLIDKR